MAFVCKQTAVWWSASLTLDNNNAVKQTFSHFSHLKLFLQQRTPSDTHCSAAQFTAQTKTLIFLSM